MYTTVNDEGLKLVSAYLTVTWTGTHTIRSHARKVSEKVRVYVWTIFFIRISARRTYASDLPRRESTKTFFTCHVGVFENSPNSAIPTRRVRNASSENLPFLKPNVSSRWRRLRGVPGPYRNDRFGRVKRIESSFLSLTLTKYALQAIM